AFRTPHAIRAVVVASGIVLPVGSLRRGARVSPSPWAGPARRAGAGSGAARELELWTLTGRLGWPRRAHRRVVRRCGDRVRSQRRRWRGRVRAVVGPNG